MFSKVATRVALLVNVVLLFVMVLGSAYLIHNQSQSLENQLLERGKIESLLGAKLVGRVISEAIDNGVFSVKEAFDTEYEKFGDFNPPKYHTKYDSYLDKAILDLEDEFLKDTDVVFAVAVDKNGYLPTHNSRYQNPITGDQKKDLVGNRTKRIFDDPIGIKAATNEQASFQQTYYRDTGETMWDISSPIFVKGKHWGGFRIGFSLEKVQAAQKQLAVSLLVILGSILLISLGLVFFLINRALSPLSHFTRIASDFADGKMDEAIKVESKDEIGQLADALERLRVSLKMAIERLRNRSKKK